MPRLLALLYLTSLIPNVFAEVKKIDALDKDLTPQVYMHDKKFAFDDLSISLLRQNKRSHLMFHMDIYRTRKNYLSQEQQIPLVLNTLISNLTPAVQVYWHGEISGIQHSIEKRLNRVLKKQYPWIDRVEISNIRIQGG